MARLLNTRTSCSQMDSKPNSLVGTYYYMSPEARTRASRAALTCLTAAPRHPLAQQLFRVHRAQSSGQAAPTYDGYKVDTWAIGITLHILLRGDDPFAGLADGLAQTENGTLSTEQLGKLRRSVLVSPECTDFIKQCLTFEHTARPTVQALAQHAWLQGTVAPEARPALACLHPCYAAAPAYSPPPRAQASGQAVGDPAVMASVADVLRRLHEGLP